MKKKISLVLLIGLIAILSVCMFACNEDKADPTYTVEPYTSFDISGVQITQKGTNTYEYVVESNIAPSATAKVYVTRYEKITADSNPVEYTVVDGKYAFTEEVKYNSYYITVVDGSNTANLPLTRPQMTPALSKTESNTAVLSYNFVSGTSWSSFCDPTGKSVYRSSSLVFGDDATLIAQNVNIFGVDSTTDISPDESEPYYFVVLSAKNGIVKYISAPITTIENLYSNIKVEMMSENGTPYIKVDGKFVTDGEVAVELYSPDEKLGKVLEIIGEAKSGSAGDDFSVTVDISQVISEKGAGIWYDIKLTTSFGNLCEISDSAADMWQTLDYDKVKFEFKEWNKILKLNYEFSDCRVDYIDIETGADGVPTLVVKGEITSEGIVDVRLHFDAEFGGVKHHYYSENVSTESGKFEFKMQLTKIPYNSSTPWCWFHIYTYKEGISTENSSELSRGSELKINQSFVYDGVRYSIRSGGSMQLVIQAEKN